MWERASRARGRGRTDFGPEDRPSKLSHALSVLRKRRIGVVMWWRSWCVREERRRREGGREGLEISVRRKEVTEEDRGWKEILS